jgi:DNA-binding HxlR family transcriptional regulator
MPQLPYDAEILKVLAEQSSLDIVTELLLNGPLRQRDFVSRLDLSAVTVSRSLNSLEKVGVVRTTGKRAPYEISFREKTEALLQAAADLASFVLTDKAAPVSARATALRKASMERAPINVARDSTA